ncbi:MAG: secondary thiamine-phosphate synthase enzyme YjbQ [Oscillospiraceae bacterium]|nr:secondary thiamine-phosphate synthase enzyme YjbQ [Oscillospiraceae bacterium]
MFYSETKEISTQKNEMIDITGEILDVLRRSGLKNGTLTVEVPHSTAGVVRTTGGLPEVAEDVVYTVKSLVPSRITFKHEESPDDAAGHIKCALFGGAVTSIIEDGKPVSGDKLHWFFMEYDGPRLRRFCVCAMGEGKGEGK